jgi:hypothetical protein
MLRRTGVRLRMGSAVDVRTLLFVSGLDMVGFLTVWYSLYLFVFLVRLKIPLDLLTRRIFQTSIVINTALCKLEKKSLSVHTLRGHVGYMVRNGSPTMKQNPPSPT